MQQSRNISNKFSQASRQGSFWHFLMTCVKCKQHQQKHCKTKKMCLI